MLIPSIGYTNMLLLTNPRSMVVLKEIREEISYSPRFHRYFLSFAAPKKGFLKGCRNFVGIDGCHLKGHFGGVLLFVVVIDVNCGIFPLVICICEVENKDMWGFFIKLLHDFLGDIESITFMSDRQEGIINAL